MATYRTAFQLLISSIFAAVLWASPSPSVAQSLAPAQRADSLLRDCRDAVVVREARRTGRSDFSEPQVYGLIQCENFLDGLFDGYFALPSRGTEIACIPAEVTRAQLRDAFIAFAAAHPEMHHQNRGEVALVAWANAFPCRR